MHSDSIHYQAVETLPVVGIVVPEQLGCIYFQGHIRVWPQEFQNPFGAVSTGTSWKEPGDGARSLWPVIEMIFQEVDFSMLFRVVRAPVPPDGTSFPSDFIQQVHHPSLSCRRVISLEVSWLYLPPEEEYQQYCDPSISMMFGPIVHCQDSQDSHSQFFPSEISSLKNVGI